MNIAVDGSNFFHTGWLARLLGLPRHHPATFLTECDLSAFEDGWDMADETLEGNEPAILQALYKMVRLGQAHVCWVDDENNEIG